MLGSLAGATPTAAVAVVAAGAAAGLVAALVMDLPMVRQPDGFTPAFVAAAVVRGRTPDAVSFRDANVVHHAAGVLAGVLYAVIVLALGVAVGPGVDPTALAGAAVVHALAVAAVVGFIYVVFAHLVLPRAGGTIYEERATAVRGQWLRSSLVFGVAMALVAPPLVGLVG
jgi:hypothetical protein